MDLVCCRLLLVWDTLKCHMMNGVKEALRQASVDAVLVPGGCKKKILQQAIQESVPNSL